MTLPGDIIGYLDGREEKEGWAGRVSNIRTKCDVTHLAMGRGGNLQSWNFNLTQVDVQELGNRDVQKHPKNLELLTKNLLVFRFVPFSELRKSLPSSELKKVVNADGSN